MRILCLSLLCCVTFGAPPMQPQQQLGVRVPMRDGVRLSTNVFLPSASGRYPAILIRTPYNKGESLNAGWQAFVNHGYAMVLQDVRGRYGSEGAFDPLGQESADGDDTLNWIAGQPWSDGKVGMAGGSYVGIAQWKVALLDNPHLKAIFPVVSGYDDYRDRFYSTGGAMKLGHRLEWMSENLKAPGFVPDFEKYVLHLPLRTSDVAATGRISQMFRSVAAHPAFDSFWRALSVREQMQKIRVPVFAIGGWYDNYAQSDLEAYAALHKSSGLNRVLIGPWPHDMSIPFAGVDFGADSSAPIHDLQMEWFDQWLKGKDAPLLSSPPVRLFVMGSNQWMESREWPPEQAHPHSLYLEPNGGLDDRPAPTSVEDRYTYDPHDPVPTKGGSICCNPRILPWGPLDQRTVERRADVLTYSTAPLKHDVEVVGPVKVVLYVATTGRDTDFTAKLVDVYPDGYARNLTDGILRLRYRNSLEKPELATPGEIYQIAVDAGVTGNVFLKGHRIRVEVSSSNFPRFDRNPNTGGPITEETRLVQAKQTIYHDRKRPSRIELMVIGAA